MIEEGLKVKFTGDADQLATELQGLQSRLKRFEDAVKSATDPKSLATFQRAVDLTKQKIETLNRSQEKSPMTAFKANADSATQSLTNLSRVAQDAPYGFIGIANNINPLLESFQRLQVETGSTANAFKTMVAGLAGPAGIGLAVGVVSSLLVAFGGNLFNSKQQVNEFVESMKALGEAADKARDSFSDLKGNMSLGAELASANIKLAEFGKIGEGNVKILEDQIKRQEKIKQGALSNRNQINLKLDEASTAIVEAPFDSEEYKAALDAKKKLMDAFNDTIKEEGEASLKLVTLRQQVALTNLQNQKEADAKAEEQREKDLAAHKKYLERLKKLAEAQAELVRIMSQIKLDAITPKITSADLPDTSFDDFTEAYITAINSHLNEGMEGILITPEIQLVLDTLDNQKKMQDAANEFLKSSVRVLKVTLATGIGESIGDIISGKGFESLFKNIASIVGDFISQMGKYLITAATAAKAFKTAFAALLKNPVAGLAVGIGLVALGQVLKNIALPKPKGFAAGGIVSGPVFGMVGEGSGTSAANPEIIAPLDRLTDLVGNGGGNFPAYLPVHEISGDTLRLWYARANASGRMFG